MSPRKFRISQPLTWIVLAAAGLAACDPADQTDVSQGCPAGSAQILVLDGALQRLCGCAETDTSIIAPPSTLSCTVSAGTVVFFQYLNTEAPHQIVSTGTPDFVDSPVSDPNNKPTIRVHAVRLDTPGTYEFTDALAVGVSGQVIVTP